MDETKISTLMRGSVILASVLCCLIAAGCGANIKPEDSETICNNKEICRDCIRTPGCSWCQDPKFEGNYRCSLSTTSGDSCKQNFTINPKGNFSLIKTEPLSHRSGGADLNQKIVQIWPQRVKVDLRINEPQKVEMRYARAAAPVDLYFLMDLSQSMHDDKENLSTLGTKLAETMRKLTPDFRLGFGSFVDKTVMPFVSTIPSKLKSPCPGCAAPYSFRHHMSLSKDAKSFSENVKKAQISGNLDSPEGGFDALMQVIVCQKEIGWRKDARRLLVFATDADFHFAGDGKLGGIIEPNDGECHMNAEGYYTMGTEQDYPSIGQINQKAKENSINIIFAVVSDFADLYQKLSNVTAGSTSATLSKDSSNVVQLIEKEYEQISSTIEMRDNATGNVKVSYRSACKSGIETSTSKCDDIKVGEEVIFNLDIVATTCPDNPDDITKFIEIKPLGIIESLIIELGMHCTCDCENPDVAQKNSSECNNVGTYMCGICDCGDSHIGKKCECSAESVSVQNSKGCFPDETTTVPCNGRGYCDCNECKCESYRYYGKYCQCDNFSCERNNQQLCSGPDHGKCECGHCLCKPGWTGNACDCMTSEEPCKPTDGGKICSGHGRCECGECKCEITESGQYSGIHCEKCPTCWGRCHELKNCVQCRMYQTGPWKNICSQNCTNIQPIGVEKVSIDPSNINEHKCEFYDEDDCKYMFKYVERNNIVELIEAQLERECPPKALIWTIVFGVIGATVLVGLLTLFLWKIITTIHDRREYARFEKERMKAKWDTGNNPIYKTATTTIDNPTFANKK